MDHSGPAQMQTVLLGCQCLAVPSVLPAWGREVFQSKSCIVCHSLNGKGGRIGSELGRERQLPGSIVQFAGEMWNHSPEMWRTSEVRNVPRPQFDGRQIVGSFRFPRQCSLLRAGRIATGGRIPVCRARLQWMPWFPRRRHPKWAGTSRARQVLQRPYARHRTLEGRPQNVSPYERPSGAMALAHRKRCRKPGRLSEQPHSIKPLRRPA